MHQTTAIEDPVTVPRGLLGAACAAIERKHDAPKTLEHLRRYTVGDLSAPDAKTDPTRDAVLHACSEALAGAEAAPIRGDWDRGFREGLGCAVTVVRAALHTPASRT